MTITKIVIVKTFQQRNKQMLGVIVKFLGPLTNLAEGKSLSFGEWICSYQPSSLNKHS